MPAEDVAVASAYLVSAFAEEYYGDRTDGYAVLERAGFLAGCHFRHQGGI